MTRSPRQVVLWSTRLAQLALAAGASLGNVRALECVGTVSVHVRIAASLLLANVVAIAPAAVVDRQDIILGHPVAESGDRLSFETYDLINRSDASRSSGGDSPLITSETEPVTVWLFGIWAPDMATVEGKKAQIAINTQLESNVDARVRCAVRELAPDGQPVAFCSKGLISYTGWMLVLGYAAACKKELREFVDEQRYLELESSAIEDERGLWRSLPGFDWRTRPENLNQERCG